MVKKVELISAHLTPKIVGYYHAAISETIKIFYGWRQVILTYHIPKPNISTRVTSTDDSFVTAWMDCHCCSFSPNNFTNTVGIHLQF